MRIFKNKWFSRFAEKEAMSDEELKAIVPLLETGQANTNLGGGVFKQRVARPGEGKSGGYRLIIFFRSREWTFFEYGFAKADRENITPEQLKKFKNMAKDLLPLTDKQMDMLVAKGVYKEITEE
jgi:hypothetical protein